MKRYIAPRTELSRIAHSQMIATSIHGDEKPEELDDMLHEEGGSGGQLVNKNLWDNDYEW